MPKHMEDRLHNLLTREVQGENLKGWDLYEREVLSDMWLRHNLEGILETEGTK